MKELLSWVSLDHYLNYTDLITARSLPRFFHDRKQNIFSRQFYQELWEHLFHNPAYIYQKEDELHILTPCTNTASACAMQHFCDQELPFHLTIKLLFIKQAYLDENAYCGYSSILQFPIENKLGKASFNQKETIML